LETAYATIDAAQGNAQGVKVEQETELTILSLAYEDKAEDNQRIIQRARIWAKLESSYSIPTEIAARQYALLVKAEGKLIEQQKGFQHCGTQVWKQTWNAFKNALNPVDMLAGSASENAKAFLKAN
jgi:hypothetical protein